MIRSVPLTVRRVRQTLTGFDNGREVLLAYLRPNIAGRPAEILFRTDGMTIACPNVAGARVPVYEVHVEGAYRLDWFTAGFPTSPVVVDVGGHIGNFTLAVTRLFPDAKVAAFEPAPTTYSYLERNISDNRRRGAAAHRLAVSDRRGTIEFLDNGAGSGLNGITNPQGATTTVESVTLADAFDLAGPEIDLLKFDAEGAEYDAVLGASVDTLKRVRRAVIEYHDVPGHDWAELRDRFAEAGLKVVAEEPTTPRLGVAWLARDL